MTNPARLLLASLFALLVALLASAWAMTPGASEPSISPVEHDDFNCVRQLPGADLTWVLCSQGVVYEEV